MPGRFRMTDDRRVVFEQLRPIWRTLWPLLPVVLVLFLPIYFVAHMVRALPEA